MEKARSDDTWSGWQWAPSRAELKKYVGTFHSERLGRVDVVRGRDGLEARLGAMRVTLTPASAGLFGASKSRLDAPEAFRYADDLRSLRWNNDTFTRSGD